MFNEDDYIKSEMIFRRYLKVKLRPLLREVDELIDKRTRNNWKVKDAKELRRKLTELKKLAGEAKKQCVNHDKRKIKTIIK